MFLTPLLVSSLETSVFTHSFLVLPNASVLFKLGPALVSRTQVTLGSVFLFVSVLVFVLSVLHLVYRHSIMHQLTVSTLDIDPF
jgi:hypothetical protein